MTIVKTSTSLWDNTNWHIAFEWALENFGHTFAVHGSTWEFVNEQDAILFALKWS